MKISLLDQLIVLSSIVICVTVYFSAWQPAQAGQMVQIRFENGVKNLSLFKDQHVQIKGPLGISEIEIHDGRARFVSSPCTAQYCVRAGWLKNGGEIAACLPNGVSLRVVGDKQFDTINF